MLSLHNRVDSLHDDCGWQHCGALRHRRKIPIHRSRIKTLWRREGIHGGILMSHRTSWGTPRGRYDGFFLSMKPRFNRSVGERTHIRRLLLADFGNGARRCLWWHGVCVSSNVEPAHNTTKILCPNLQWGCQSHRFAENKGLNLSCGRWYLFEVSK
jgi:hypothetical protein